MECPTCGQDNPDRAKFCLECGAALTVAGEPATESRKVVTIVFGDMAGSTAIGERLDPEALRRVRDRGYFDAMTAVDRATRRHGREVHRRRRHGRLGIPRLHEDDPLRAVRAAEGMQTCARSIERGPARDHGIDVRSASA